MARFIAAQKIGKRLKVKKVLLKKVLISDDLGFDELIAPMILNLIYGSRPLYSKFYHPNLFSVYFERNIKNKIVDHLIGKCATILTEKKECLENSFIRYCEDYFICRQDNFGKIRSEPIGSGIIYNPENMRFSLKNTK